MIAIHRTRFAANGLEFILGEGRFVAPMTIEVHLAEGGPRHLEGQSVFLDLGTHATIPDIPGLAAVGPLTHVEALELDRLPEHVVVLGGGYVGLEMAQASRRFGSEVTVVEQGPQLVPREDPDVAEAIRRMFLEDGIEVALETGADCTPPTGRVALVNGLEAWLETSGGRFALGAQRYTPDVVHPDGDRRIVDFHTDPWPSWIFRATDGTVISQEVVACRERGYVVVRWRLRSLPRSVQLRVRPLLSGRDYHALHHENPGFDFGAEGTGARVLKPGGRLVIGELGRYFSWAAWRRLRDWLGHATWRAARFRTARELCGLATNAGLAVRAAVFYPPIAPAAAALALLDAWLGRRFVTSGAFLALLATKLSTPLTICRDAPV